MYVLCTLFTPAAEICARLAGNYCQQLTTVKSGANDLVWQTVCFFTASQQGGGRGAILSISLHYLAQGERQVGGSVPSPWHKHLGSSCRISVCAVILGTVIYRECTSNGSGMFVPDPDFYIHLGSRINNSNKRGEKVICCLTFLQPQISPN